MRAAGRDPDGVDCMDLGMGCAGLKMITFSDYDAVMHHHSPTIGLVSRVPSAIAASCMARLIHIRSSGVVMNAISYL
jgi:hypothetical protein